MKLIGEESQEEMGNDPGSGSASEGGLRKQEARERGLNLEPHQRSLKKMIRSRGFGEVLSYWIWDAGCH